MRDLEETLAVAFAMLLLLGSEIVASTFYFSQSFPQKLLSLCLCTALYLMK
jgi:hypothetical protein